MTDEHDQDRALRGLPRLDLPPLAARALLVAAQRRLASREQPVSWLERQEATLLLALCAAHLAWALIQVGGP